MLIYRWCNFLDIFIPPNWLPISQVNKGWCDGENVYPVQLYDVVKCRYVVSLITWSRTYASCWWRFDHKTYKTIIGVVPIPKEYSPGIHLSLLFEHFALWSEVVGWFEKKNLDFYSQFVKINSCLSFKIDSVSLCLVRPKQLFDIFSSSFYLRINWRFQS